MKYLLPFAILLLLTAASCRKNKTTEQLPPETHEGKFTFGCKVDGKIYTAIGEGGLLATDHLYYTFSPNDSLIYIGAGSTSGLKNKFNIFLTIKYVGKTGSYLMATFPDHGIFIDENNGNVPGGSNTFITSEIHKGNVNVKFFDGVLSPHIVGTILSGTFEMDAVNSEGKIIHITEGRFDIGH